jgi:glyoxylase-like metal-dependent hydrolase (beta-lactamase superfamily II)
VRRVAEGVYALDAAGSMSNVFLVEAEVPTLVDTGVPRHAKAILAELREAGVEPGRILLTHGDFDHVGGAAFLREQTGAEVCAPAAERPLLARNPSFRPGLLRRVLFRVFPFPPPVVDRWLADGETVGGIEAVATPGHTPGHTSYVFGKTLLAGDAIVTLPYRFKEPPARYSLDPHEARRSIARLAELDVDVAVSGHGAPGQDAKKKLRDLAKLLAPR